MQLTNLLPATLLPLLALSTHLRFSVVVTPALPNPATLPPSTSASLTTLSHSYVAPLGTDNSFNFRNVSSGSYLLDVVSPTYAFAPLRVDVSDDGETVKAWGTWRGNEWENKGETMVVGGSGRGAKTIAVRAVAKKEYLVERAGFSPLSILNNPMILMAGVGMLMMFGMPMLMENMDPGTKAEFEERQKSAPGASLLNGQGGQGGVANFDAAAWLAGTPAKKDAPQEKGITR